MPGPHVLTEEELACLRGCSEYVQYFQMRRSFEDQRCRFCDVDRELHTVLYDSFGWMAWEVPEEFTTRGDELALQLIFFPKRHIRHLNELTFMEWIGFIKVVLWIYRKYDIPGGVFFVRVGDMRYNVGTVPHLHFNLFIPNLTKDVWVPFYKVESGETWHKHEASMQAFARRYEAGEVPE